MAKRLFVGISVSKEVGRNIRSVQEVLVKSGADFALVSVKNLHFTFHFLGEVDDVKIPPMLGILSRIARHSAPFSFPVQGVGVFPSLERITVIWAGSSNEKLSSLMKSVKQSLAFVRQDEHEEEVPHLTIARVKSGKNQQELREVLGKVQGRELGTVFVDRIILWESVLTPQGPVYTVVKEFILGTSS